MTALDWCAIGACLAFGLSVGNAVASDDSDTRQRFTAVSLFFLFVVFLLFIVNTELRITAAIVKNTASWKGNEQEEVKP